MLHPSCFIWDIKWAKMNTDRGIFCDELWKYEIGIACFILQRNMSLLSCKHHLTPILVISDSVKRLDVPLWVEQIVQPLRCLDHFKLKKVKFWSSKQLCVSLCVFSFFFFFCKPSYSERFLMEVRIPCYTHNPEPKLLNLRNVRGRCNVWVTQQHHCC